jgi:hypothetical protein
MEYQPWEQQPWNISHGSSSHGISGMGAAAMGAEATGIASTEGEATMASDKQLRRGRHGSSSQRSLSHGNSSYGIPAMEAAAMGAAATGIAAQKELHQSWERQPPPPQEQQPQKERQQPQEQQPWISSHWSSCLRNSDPLELLNCAILHFFLFSHTVYISKQRFIDYKCRATVFIGTLNELATYRLLNFVKQSQKNPYEWHVIKRSIFDFFSVQAKLSNFQYRPSEKVPNARMKHTDKHISKLETVISVCNDQ